MPSNPLAKLYLGTGAILSNSNHWMSYHIPGYALQAFFLWLQDRLRISSEGFLKDS